MTFEPDLGKAKRFLAAHAAPGAIVAGVTGAHAYGFPSADSDLDLKGIHVERTAAVVSLHPPADHVDFLGVFGDLEIDYTSHELGLALRLLIKGNGNILERVLTPLHAIDCSEREELAALALGSLSRRFGHHYLGFFRTVRDLARKERTAKRFLYAYRSALSGIHLLRSSECVLDVSRLGPEHGFTRVEELIAMKREGAEKGLVHGDTAPYESDFARLETSLADAATRSPLPLEPANVPALDDFLIRRRRVHF